MADFLETYSGFFQADISSGPRTTIGFQKIRHSDALYYCGHNIFPIITLWELSVAMDTRVAIRSGPKPNAAFPPPQ